MDCLISSYREDTARSEVVLTPGRVTGFKSPGQVESSSQASTTVGGRDSRVDHCTLGSIDDMSNAITKVLDADEERASAMRPHMNQTHRGQ